MHQDALPYLAGPCCAAPLAFRAISEREGVDVLEAILSCACGKSYRVHRGVADFVEPADADSSLRENMTAWDFIWEKAAGLPPNHFTSEEMFETDFQLPREAFKGAVVLEAGIGPGKYLPYILARSPAFLFGIDISMTLFDLPRLPGKVCLVRGDIRRLPFRRGAFDLVLSARTLHHIPDVELRLKQLAELLGPRGRLMAVLYGRSEGRDGFIRVVEVLKRVLRLLPRSWLFYLSWLPSAGVFVAARLYRAAGRWARMLPLHEVMIYWAKLDLDSLWRYIIFDILIAPRTRYLSDPELALLIDGLPGLRWETRRQHEAMWNVSAFRDIRGPQSLEKPS